RYPRRRAVAHPQATRQLRGSGHTGRAELTVDDAGHALEAVDYAESDRERKAVRACTKLDGRVDYAPRDRLKPQVVRHRSGQRERGALLVKCAYVDFEQGIAVAQDAIDPREPGVVHLHAVDTEAAAQVGRGGRAGQARVALERAVLEAGETGESEQVVNRHARGPDR